MTAARAWLARHGLNILGWTLVVAALAAAVTGWVTIGDPDSTVGWAACVADLCLVVILAVVGTILAAADRPPRIEVPDELPTWLIREVLGDDSEARDA